MLNIGDDWLDLKISSLDLFILKSLILTKHDLVLF